jgi:hypothetical protein
VRIGNHKLLQELFDRELSIVGRHQSASHYTIRLARMLGRFDLVETIINNRPRLWGPCQFLPLLWVPVLQSLSVPLDTAEVVLSDMDHTIPTDAATEANLLSLVLKVKQRGSSKTMKSRHRAAAQAHTAKDLTDLLQGYPALHVAICGSGTQLVALLLEHGADPNQYCGAYPIQLAARLVQLEIVKILIEHGCEVDDVGTNHLCYLIRIEGMH